MGQVGAENVRPALRPYVRKDPGCRLRCCTSTRTPSVTPGCRPFLCTGCFGFVLPSSALSGNSRKNGTRWLARSPLPARLGRCRGGSGSRGSPARRDPRDVILPRVRSAAMGVGPVGRLVSLVSASVDSTRPSSRIHPPRYCLTKVRSELCRLWDVACGFGRRSPRASRATRACET